MFVRKYPYIIYRAFPENGYLTDNRNFGYDTASNSSVKLGDLLLSKEGSVFYSQLEDNPLEISAIVDKLCAIFIGVTRDRLLEDTSCFFQSLAEKGFVYCGDSESLDNNPLVFSYGNRVPYGIEAKMDDVSFPFQDVFGGQYRLTRVHVDISSCCNENCVHCYIPISNKHSIMAEDMFDTVLAECVKMKVLNITLSGGEPMLNPHFKTFIQKCIKENMSVNILSNLTLLTPELLDVIASSPLISVQTSLYAMDESVHDLITQKAGSFKKTKEGILRLHERNVPMQINCPIMKQNLQYYHDVLDFAKSMNIESSADYALFGCYDGSCSNIGCRIEVKDVKCILEHDFSNSKKLAEIMDAVGQKKVNDDDPICSICKSSLCISNMGEVYPCEGWQRMILGNISKQSLDEIWTNNAQTKHLRNLRFRDVDKCGSCQIRKYCTTCLILNANETPANDYMSVNPYVCEMARVKQQIIESKQQI